MSRDVFLNWIVDWFSQRGPIPATFDMQSGNYVEAGLIDSLTVIDLVEELEAAFDVSFDEVAFQDRRFVSMAGLAEIVGERAKEAVARNNS